MDAKNGNTLVCMIRGQVHLKVSCFLPINKYKGSILSGCKPLHVISEVTGFR